MDVDKLTMIVKEFLVLILSNVVSIDIQASVLQGGC